MNSITKSILRINLKFFKPKNLFSNTNRYFCEKLPDQMKNNVINEDQNEFKTFQKRAEDVIKVMILSVPHMTLKDCIKGLNLSVSYNIRNKEFLTKFEEKIIKFITDIETKDLSKIIFGFYNLGYTESKKLNFMLERSIIRNQNFMETKDFTIIFKSYSKVKIANTGLLACFNNFLNKNLEKFQIFETADIIISYPKIFIDHEIFDYELIKKLYERISQHISNLGINRLINIYLVLYGGNDMKLKSLFQYDERLLDIIISKKEQLTAKHAYLVLVTHHFSKIPFKVQLAECLNSILVESLNKFLPEETMTILNIINDDKNKTLFSEAQFEIQKINAKLLDSIGQNVSEIDSKESILLLTGLLQNKENLDKMPDFNDKVDLLINKVENNENELGLNDINNIIDLTRFKYPIGKYDKSSIASLILEKMRRKTDFNSIEYNNLMISCYNFGIKREAFWVEYLSYLKVIDIYRFNDFLKIKSVLKSLDKDLIGQKLFLLNIQKFLEDKYELDKIDEAKKLV